MQRRSAGPGLPPRLPAVRLAWWTFVGGMTAVNTALLVWNGRILVRLLLQGAP